MNVYLSHLRDQYNELRSGIEAIHTAAANEPASVEGGSAGRELSEDELRSIEHMNAQAEALLPQIRSLTAVEQRNAEVADLRARLAEGDEPTPGGIPALLPSAAQLVQMRALAAGDAAARRFTVGERGADELRAAVTTSATGLGSTARVGSPLPEPRRIAVAAGLSGETVDGVTGEVYPVFSAGTASITAEGATKQEYAAVAPGTAVPQMISVWTDSTRQVLLSMPGYERRLLAKHAALIAKAEDALLVARLLASGLPTLAGASGADRRDTLLTAAATVMSSDVATAPSLALINPADVAKIFPAATTTGSTGEAPTHDLRLDLHGMTIYPTSAVAAGTAIVGAFAAGSHLVVGMRPTVLVDSMSQLKTNKITHLSEEAVTLGVDEPLAFVNVTALTA